MPEVVAVYGQKKIPVPAGWTQEQVKAQMARFFPELADPKIESKKDGDKTEWVFSKKAGTKGARAARATAATTIAQRLQQVKETPVAPTWLVWAALGNGHQALRKNDVQKVEAAIERLGAETRAVVSIREALVYLPPAWSKQQGDSLL